MMNKYYYKKVKENWDNLVKPLDSLGEFEEIIARIGGIISNDNIDLTKSALLVFCSDNGIVAENVAQSDERVTRDVTMLLGLGKSSVCRMARREQIDVFPINLGVKYTEDFVGVINDYYISSGTKNFAIEKAMTVEQLEQAMAAGAKCVNQMYENNYKCILLGEMGIGNTTTSAAVISSLLKLNPEMICGRGSGLSSEGLLKKVAVVKSAIEKYDLYNCSPVEVLQAVGGYDIAAMVGAIHKAIELNIPVVLDGVITAAAALVAYMMNSETKDIIFFSHKGRENGVMAVADFFDINPILDANLALGEGTGAVLFMSMLKTALEVYHGTKFSEIEMEAYERLV